MTTSLAVCSVPECDRPAKTRGWCQKHYMRWWHNGRLETKPVISVCTVEGCSKPHKARGYCSTHYARWRHHGTVSTISIPTDSDRFWSKVEKSEGCWLWTAGLTTSGYGKFHVGGRRDGRTLVAHRFAYEELVGPIPESSQLDHLCRVRHCVRPDHLEPVTAAVNNARSESPSARNARKTHCPRNHQLSGGNLKINPRTGARSCRECGREAARRWKARNAAHVQVYMKAWREAH